MNRTLYVLGDRAMWALDHEAMELKKTAQGLGIKSTLGKPPFYSKNQLIYTTFVPTKNFFLKYGKKHSLAFDYYHGKDLTNEYFKDKFERVKNNLQYIARIRVTNKIMRDFVLKTGISKDKISIIPIGINMDYFKPQTKSNKEAARDKLGIPRDSFVVGSFQKDGVGWGQGLKPKFEKGPDIFLKVMEKLNAKIPNVYILLTGPARGFVKEGLDQLDIPYRHDYLNDYPQISNYYQTLDLYIVTSREEGGPKAILESMAAGIPLITTRVGQATGLVRSGINAAMVDIEDVEGLTKAAMKIYKDRKLRNKLIYNGFKTARTNSYKSQIPLWNNFFEKIEE